MTGRFPSVVVFGCQSCLLAASLPALPAAGQEPFWAEVSPLPEPRKSHAMAYDSARDRVVIFGGGNLTQQRFGDTWEWDGSMWRWRSTTGPSPRDEHAMAYDAARERVVLFVAARVGG